MLVGFEVILLNLNSFSARGLSRFVFLFFLGFLLSVLSILSNCSRQLFWRRRSVSVSFTSRFLALFVRLLRLRFFFYNGVIDLTPVFVTLWLLLFLAIFIRVFGNDKRLIKISSRLCLTVSSRSSSFARLIFHGWATVIICEWHGRASVSASTWCRTLVISLLLFTLWSATQHWVIQTCTLLFALVFFYFRSSANHWFI